MYDFRVDSESLGCTSVGGAGPTQPVLRGLASRGEKHGTHDKGHRNLSSSHQQCLQERSALCPPPALGQAWAGGSDTEVIQTLHFSVWVDPKL